MEGFTIEGWDDFVENFSKFVDKWADKKKILLQRMANIYHGEVIPHVPVDTSRLQKRRLNSAVLSSLITRLSDVRVQDLSLCTR